jgi:hypothetical protein
LGGEEGGGKQEGALKCKGMKTEVATVYSPIAKHIGAQAQTKQTKTIVF